MGYLIRILALALAVAPALVFAQADGFNPKVARRLRADVFTLADDAMEGRKVGTRGERMAADYLTGRMAQLNLVEHELAPAYRSAFTAQPKVHGVAQGAPVTGHNVVGVVRGRNPKLAPLVVGAHYDHWGWGGEGSLYRGKDSAIHNGADDNASGVAAVLELAYRLQRAKPKRSVVVVAFSGEEQGLWGSNDLAKKMAALPVKPAAMINMDMVGRLGSTRQLALYGVGTSPAWPEALAAAGASEKFRLKIDSSGVGPSDHTSFYLTDVPVLHLFTGQHADYHQPSDDADKINFDGLAEVVDLVETVLRQLDERTEVPFTKTKSSASDTPRFKVTLGVVPDYLYDGQGMRIDGTTDGKPAARAGLQRGDVVVAIGWHPVAGMTGYMEALSKFDTGQETTVTVLRDGVKLVLPLTF
jgi:Zn-dependent M28 family amino/carboxypeptidase